MSDNIDESSALNHLDQIDEKHGINQQVEIHKKEPSKSLGKASTYSNSMSDAEESPWKILNFSLLPSEGLFYEANSEIVLKSAKNKEIKHWSTMDEHDPIDVREKINFILNKCIKFKVKGTNHRFNANDISNVDLYHLLFRIHELTFPNMENKLMAKIKCKSKACGHVNKIQVTSKNLIGFNIPSELMQWYSQEEKCFVVESEKVGETLRFYMPTNGVLSELRRYKNKEIQKGRSIDDSFYSIAPYMVKDWRDLTDVNILQIKSSYDGWGGIKFTAVYKFIEELKKTSLNRVLGSCEKCKSRLEDHIFLGGSFTTKDIFIISGGFNEFIGA